MIALIDILLSKEWRNIKAIYIQQMEKKFTLLKKYGKYKMENLPWSIKCYVKILNYLYHLKTNQKSKAHYYKWAIYRWIYWQKSGKNQSINFLPRDLLIDMICQ